MPSDTGSTPAKKGGRIDVDIARLGERCVVRVTDTGAGLHHPANGLGTGLTTLRERLQLIFGDAAHLRLIAGVPRGVVVEVDMPAQTVRRAECAHERPPDSADRGR